MGKIIHSKILPNKKVVCKILLDPEEMTNIKGHMKNIFLFSSNLCNHQATINTRGNNGVTKYFKIPLSIRTRKKIEGTLSYQKSETPSKMFYIYTINPEEDNYEDQTLKK